MVERRRAGFVMIEQAGLRRSSQGRRYVINHHRELVVDWDWLELAGA